MSADSKGLSRLFTMKDWLERVEIFMQAGSGLLSTSTNIQNFKQTVILGQTLYLLSI
jgi:hypothetical protein